MSGRTILVLVLALSGLFVLGPVVRAEPDAARTRGGRFDIPVTPQEIAEAIARGVDFLVARQNADGSWGSPAPNLFLDIYSPAPGSQQAYEVASSALALSALLEVGGERDGVTEAVRRGADWLLAHHAVRRVNPRVLYNNWAHAYALEAFARLLAREEDGARRRLYRKAGREAVALLRRFQFVDGGWGYYDFDLRSKTPGHGHATSFTTATVLVALRMAKEQGVAVPARMVDRAVRMVRLCRRPGGAYAYSFDFAYRVPWGVNKPEGSLARTPACQASLLAWNDSVPTVRIVRALDRLEEKGHFLRIARKYPVPHETWFQNSGYFCFYGYYYARLLADQLPDAKREFHRRRFAAHLVPLQEENGSWWDYQLFGYHEFYGTGFVLMTLGRCLPPAAVRPSSAPSSS